MKNRAQGLIKNRPNRIDRDLTLQSNKGLRRIFMPKKTPSQGQKTSFFCVVELIQTEGGFRMWQEEAAGLKMMRDIHMFDISGFSSDWFQVPISVVKIWNFFPLAFQRSGHFRTSVQYSWGLLLGHVEFSLCAFFSPPPSGVVDDDEMP